MAKYAKNRNYVPPSKGKTVLVRPSKDKDGVVKQDWDVYKLKYHTDNFATDPYLTRLYIIWKNSS